MLQVLSTVIIIYNKKFMKVQNNKNVNNYECLVRRTFYCLGSCPFYPSKTVV